jgi:hypothetical protein
LAHYPKADEREAFYVKIIGIGLQALAYTETWHLIFKSQLLLLKALNQKVLQFDEARTFYDAAAREYATEYATDTFDRWLEFMRSQFLITQEGARIAITQRGRDFLKYLVHTGRSEDVKRL